ncbi:hypothetical protein J2Z76_002707 [Sedimentibacter acidaminivorans]|uniref:Tail fiber protein n=1 Tax=Sedimentibacter acidaminivorans TaxID=913099 RepID=A0ABS4GGT8_9FIRM|nr:hypothetical protein [Sedimentibacter acidaminivorans]MBP1926837.1 hypothetical protein [Sedimentibacter acidaminivorans]
MSFGGLLFTNLGKNLQAKSMTGSELRFTKIVIGDGELGSGSILDLRNVVHEIKSLEITKLKSTPDGKAILGTKFDNNTISVGFYWREIGVFAMDPDIGEILYCYGNAGTNADYIPASGGAQVIEKVIDLPIIIGNATNVTATIASGLYVSAEDFENEVNSINTEIVALNEHIDDLNGNKADLVGGKVPSEQLPEMDYINPTDNTKDNIVSFIEASTDIDIKTNETHSTLFGKILKSIKTLRTSISNIINGTTTVAKATNSNYSTSAGNADKLDGNDSSAFATSGHTHSGYAPASHASSGTGYGVGTTGNYGHVKLVDSLTSTLTSGAALTPKQGKLLNDKIITNIPVLIATVNLNSTSRIDIGNYFNNKVYDMFILYLIGSITFKNISTSTAYSIGIRLDYRDTITSGTGIPLLSGKISSNSTLVVPTNYKAVFHSANGYVKNDYFDVNYEPEYLSSTTRGANSTQMSILDLILIQ